MTLTEEFETGLAERLTAHNVANQKLKSYTGLDVEYAMALSADTIAKAGEVKAWREAYDLFKRYSENGS